MWESECVKILSDRGTEGDPLTNVKALVEVGGAVVVGEVAA